MYARPTFLTCGSFLFTHASAQPCHSLSRHIGTPFGSSMHTQPFVPSRRCFILPSAPISMTAAFREISGGAALIARAIFPESPEPAFGSCAAAVHATMTARTITTAVSLRIVASVNLNDRRRTLHVSPRVVYSSSGHAAARASAHALPSNEEVPDATKEDAETDEGEDARGGGGDTEFGQVNGA